MKYTVDRRRMLAGSVLAGLPSFVSASNCIDVNRPDSTVSVPGGRRIGYRNYGVMGGVPVLYFHGSPGSRFEAEFLADAAANLGVCLVSVDRPGMGLSTFSTRCFVHTTPGDIRVLIEHLRRTLSFDRVGILATSGGTPYALACAEQLPNLINSVAVVSPRTPLAPGVPISQLDRKLMLSQRFPRLSSRFLQRQFRLLRQGSNRAGRNQFEMFAQIDQRFAATHSTLLRRIMLESSRCGVVGIRHDFSQLLWPWRICFDKIRCPVSLWHGMCDYSAPRETIGFLQGKIRHAEANIFPREGHFTMLPETASASIGWLLKQLAYSHTESSTSVLL